MMHCRALDGGPAQASIWGLGKSLVTMTPPAWKVKAPTVLVGV